MITLQGRRRKRKLKHPALPHLEGSGQEHWFTLLGPAHQRAEVAAGDAKRETFDLRVVAVGAEAGPEYQQLIPQSLQLTLEPRTFTLSLLFTPKTNPPGRLRSRTFGIFR